MNWGNSTATRWVRMYFDDMLNDAMAWARASDEADRYLEQWAADNAIDYKTVVLALKPVMDLIQKKIAYYIGDHDWWVWVTRYRGDYIVMESDGDYRIHVFHEKMDSGEWSLT